MGVMASFLATINILHPYALAMACGVGSGMTHGAGRLALHGLGVELEIARKDDRIHRFLKTGDTVRTSFLTHLAALFFGRQILFLSDHGSADYAEQQAHDDNNCFFHST